MTSSQTEPNAAARTTRLPPSFARWDSFEFWEACLAHELRLQRCLGCERFRYQPRPFCPWCRSPDHEWAAVSGRGTVYTYTICHPPVLPQFADRVPFNAIVVELEEAPFMVSNLVDCDDDAIRVGMPVKVKFVDVADNLTLPLFRPATV